MRSPKPFFLGFAWLLAGFPSFSGFQRQPLDVSRVLLATVLHGLGTKPAGVRVFRMRFCLVACYLSLLRSVGDFSMQFFYLIRFLFLGLCRSVGDVFSGFQKQRFGIFLAAVSHGLDVLLSFSIVRFVGDVSRVFLATVLHGLSTKPAWVLLFRMRSPKTFFLGFAVPSVTFWTFCYFSVVLTF